MAKAELGPCDARLPNDAEHFMENGAIYATTAPIFGICNLLLQEYLGEVPAVCQFAGSKSACKIPGEIQADRNQATKP